MTERDALLSTILANPDDDIARLVYADWLEETAEPAAVARARFIRLQIECARCPPDASFSPHADEIDALAARWAREWLMELPAPVAKAVREERRGAGAFRRGFVDGITLSTEAFMWTVPALLAAAPVTEMHIHGAFKGMRTALWSPYISRLRGLRLSGVQDGNRLAGLVATSSLGEIRELDLSDCRITDLAASYLRRLLSRRRPTVLRVRRNLLTEDGIDHIASVLCHEPLAQLDVTGNPGARNWTDAQRARYGNRLVF
jgi:uncharacterized protein (TIGR02996 family)